MKFKKICVIGLGYIGLPTAAVLSSSGYDVIGLDVNIDVVEKVNRGEIHIIEPGLEDIVKKAVNNGKFIAHKKWLFSENRSDRYQAFAQFLSSILQSSCAAFFRHQRIN